MKHPFKEARRGCEKLESRSRKNVIPVVFGDPLRVAMPLLLRRESRQ